MDEFIVKVNTTLLRVDIENMVMNHVQTCINRRTTSDVISVFVWGLLTMFFVALVAEINELKRTIQIHKHVIIQLEQQCMCIGATIKQGATKHSQ